MLTCTHASLIQCGQEIEGVGYTYADLPEVIQRYDPSVLKDGYNDLLDGEKIYFISNPALGLWSCRDRSTSDA
jgi:hypothetical protein